MTELLKEFTPYKIQLTPLIRKKNKMMIQYLETSEPK